MLIPQISNHDTANGIVTISYTDSENSNNTHEDVYELIHVVPGTWRTLKDQNLTFTEDMQANVINTLIGWHQQLHANNAFHFHLPGTRPKDFQNRKFFKP